MRTFFFQDYLNMDNGKFIPSAIFESEEFGRHFLLDANFEFISAPSSKMVVMMRANWDMFQSGLTGRVLIWIGFLESTAL